MLAFLESGLTGLESMVVRAGGVVKRAAAPGSVQDRAGTPWRRCSCHTAVHGHRGATLIPAPHMPHSTVSASCTPPGASEENRDTLNLLNGDAEGFRGPHMFTKYPIIEIKAIRAEPTQLMWVFLCHESGFSKQAFRLK